ncbi:hypothetical protein AOQ84DRAFT_226311 [Glonium stellatum]|uniref:Uncharacterized protein n=1 Tax=Glonium stellatum TaxID=574774 RepID=A0A8E2FB00_9PEZI|nr:hypothetical protein AOQ84DRAFT_226311 [Glonium stellatum]
MLPASISKWWRCEPTSAALPSPGSPSPSRNGEPRTLAFSPSLTAQSAPTDDFGSEHLAWTSLESFSYFAAALGIARSQTCPTLPGFVWCGSPAVKLHSFFTSAWLRFQRGQMLRKIQAKNCNRTFISATPAPRTTGYSLPKPFPIALWR